jgi:hypothetical protein
MLTRMYKFTQYVDITEKELAIFRKAIATQTSNSDKYEIVVIDGIDLVSTLNISIKLNENPSFKPVDKCLNQILDIKVSKLGKGRYHFDEPAETFENIRQLKITGSSPAAIPVMQADENGKFNKEVVLFNCKKYIEVALERTESIYSAVGFRDVPANSGILSRLSLLGSEYYLLSTEKHGAYFVKEKDYIDNGIKHEILLSNPDATAEMVARHPVAWIVFGHKHFPPEDKGDTSRKTSWLNIVSPSYIENFPKEKIWAAIYEYELLPLFNITGKTVGTETVFQAQAITSLILRENEYVSEKRAVMEKRKPKTTKKSPKK